RDRASLGRQARPHGRGRAPAPRASREKASRRRFGPRAFPTYRWIGWSLNVQLQSVSSSPPTGQPMAAWRGMGPQASSARLERMPQSPPARAACAGGSPSSPRKQDRMQPFETIYIDSMVAACNGGGGPLGHPKVYLNLSTERKAECPYCSRLFV